MDVFDGFDLVILVFALIGMDRVLEWALKLELPERKNPWR